MFKFIKENKKWIYIVIITIVLFIVISILINSCSHLVVDSMMQGTESETSIQKLSMYKEYEAMSILKGIAQKNGDWKKYPLSKNFLAKYNSKDGIFQQYSFEEISCNTMVREKYSENVKAGSFYYNLYNYIDRQRHIVGPAWEVYINYRINNNNELDSIEIISDKQTVDEYGDQIRDYDKEFTYKNLYIITHILFFDHNWSWYSQALDPINIKKEPCSKKLIEKVLNKNLINAKGLSQHNEYVYGGNMYIDFFSGIKYSFGRFYYDKGVSIEQSVKNKKFYAVCQLYNDDADPLYSDDLPEKNYMYKVQFELDNENKLDDIWVEYIGEISNEELAEEYD